MSSVTEINAQYKIISETYGIPLLMVDQHGKRHISFNLLSPSSELLFHFSDFKRRALEIWTQYQKPVIISSELNQIWGGFSVFKDKTIQQTVVIGPVFLSDASKNMIVEYAYTYDIAEKNRERLLAALNQTQVSSYLEFSRLVAMIHGLTYAKFLDPSSLQIVRLSNQAYLPFSELSWEQRIFTQKGGSTNPSILFEQNLFDSIREGNLGKLKRLLMTSNYTELPQFQYTTYIRVHKNNFIGLLFMVTHMAIAGRLNWALAYSLNEQYAQQVESLRDVDSILNLTREMLYDFTARVGSLNIVSDHSKRVNDCCNFIYEYVNENLKVADIAAFSGFSPNYISKIFKEETGKTINEYIRQAKIEEAKTLLRYSSLSLAEISQQLSFSSQSFFTATFHRTTGLTPRQYRNTDEE